jgi:hypothetical protein
LTLQGRREVSVEDIAALCGVGHTSSLDGHPDLTEIREEEPDDMSADAKTSHKANTGNVLLL